MPSRKHDTKIREELQPKTPVNLTVSMAFVGVILFAIGIDTSLLLGLSGSFLIAAAFASRFEGRIGRPQQVLIMLGIFLVGACLAWFGLGVREIFKRSCIPEGDCAQRH